MSKIKIKSITKFLLAIRPDHGSKDKVITLTEGKTHTFKDAKEYAAYERCCSTFIQSNPPKLKMVIGKEKEEVEAPEEAEVEEVVEEVEAPEEAEVEEEPEVEVEKPVAKKKQNKKAGRKGRRK